MKPIFDDVADAARRDGRNTRMIDNTLQERRQQRLAELVQHALGRAAHFEQLAEEWRDYAAWYKALAERERTDPTKTPKDDAPPADAPATPPAVVTAHDVGSVMTGGHPPIPGPITAAGGPADNGVDAGQGVPPWA